MKYLYLTLILAMASFGEIPSGVKKEYAIAHKFSENVEGYFYSSALREVKKTMTPKHDWQDFHLSPEECVNFSAGSKTMVLYVPPGYKEESKGYGIYLHNSAGAKGVTPKKDWQALMEKYQLIYISPNEAKNGTPFIRRVALGLDGVATIKKQFTIDPERVFVGGISGGGHVGMLSQMMYPEVYYGAISHAAQSYLPKPGLSQGHFFGMSERDCTSGLRKDRPWVVISGNKDKNYKEVLKTSELWEKHRMDYEFIDIPGMAHTNASGPALERALIRVGAKPVPKLEYETQREWVSAAGSSLNATLISLNGDKVSLKTEAGKTISLTRAQLSKEDQTYLSKFDQ